MTDLELTAHRRGVSTVVRVAGEVDLVFSQCSRTVLRTFQVSGMAGLVLGDGGTAHRQSS